MDESRDLVFILAAMAAVVSGGHHLVLGMGMGMGTVRVAPEALHEVVRVAVAGAGSAFGMNRSAQSAKVALEQQEQQSRPDSSTLQMSGTELMELRKRVGLSREELADRLGYSRSQIQRWETGQHRIPRAAYARIADVLETERRQLEAYRTVWLTTIASWETIGAWGTKKGHQ